MKELNKIYKDDWLNNDLPDKSVQLIIADPPYYKVKGDFDFVWKTFDDYLKDVERWAIECKRVLADNGTLYWYGDSKNIAYAQVIFDEHFDLINNIVWDKGSFMGLEESEGIRSFAPCTERILMYTNETYNLTQCVSFIRDYIRSEIEKSKGKIVLKEVNEVLGTATNGGGVASACLSLDKAEPTMITKEMYEKLQDWCKPFLTTPYEILRAEYEILRAEYEILRRPFNNQFKLQEIVRFSNEASKTGAKYDHDTVKPEKLTRALILTCSRENDLVLVPFAGSGTECAMSIKEGRNFIGFDIEQKYVEIANKRVDLIKQTPQLF
jgi:site-specific DNA-methyltransferase (adenine-specific)